MRNYIVSDPCCTAGFLFELPKSSSKTSSLRSLLYGGVFVCMAEYDYEVTGLRSLLYGGVFVFEFDYVGKHYQSQIPAVRRGFCL